jgi:hypothetical protein
LEYPKHNTTSGKSASRRRGSPVCAIGLGDRPKLGYGIPPEVVSLILSIREERRNGAVQTSLYLQRHYHAYVSPTTILKIFHRNHVCRIALEKYRHGPKPIDPPLQVPGRSVQLDVKFAPRVGRSFKNQKDLARKLKRWEAHDNEDRPISH